MIIEKYTTFKVTDMVENKSDVGRLITVEDITIQIGTFHNTVRVTFRWVDNNEKFECTLKSVEEMVHDKEIEKLEL